MVMGAQSAVFTYPRDTSSGRLTANGNVVRAAASWLGASCVYRPTSRVTEKCAAGTLFVEYQGQEKFLQSLALCNGELVQLNPHLIST